jgi:hypothetical protein
MESERSIGGVAYGGRKFVTDSASLAVRHWYFVSTEAIAGAPYQ